MKVSKDFGIVIRRAAIETGSVDLSAIMQAFHFTALFDESDRLVSLGPFFGSEAADDCMRSLEKLGLVYVDDFFIFETPFPDWLSFEVF